MAVQPIRLFGDPVLRTPAEPVVDFDKQLRTLVDDLFETMLAAPGRGLAAPQIGVGLRVFTYVIDSDVHGHLVNPELSFPDDEEQFGEEGCLSIPEQYAEVARPASARVKWLDEAGAAHEEQLTGLLATCMQHEIDHLNGVLFIDHLSRLKRDMVLKKLSKMRKAA